MRTKRIPTQFKEYEMFPNNTLINEVDFVHLTLLANIKLVEFEQAMKERTWFKAMKEEIRQIKKNKTQELLDLLVGKKPINVKWVYKTKLRPNGKVEKYKATLLFKGFLQKASLDYQEVFTPVVRIETIKLLVALATFKGQRLH